MKNFCKSTTTKSVRDKWDCFYNPWMTKILAAVVLFAATYGTNMIGPFGSDATLVLSATAALVTIWNPGFGALTYIAAAAISMTHIDPALSLIILAVLLIYCSAGYAATAVMSITAVFFINPSMPDGAYWGLAVLAMFFAYRSRESWISLIFPSYLTLLLFMFGRFGTAGLLAEARFVPAKSTAADIDAFIAGIDFMPHAEAVWAYAPEIVKLFALVTAACCTIWLIFKNKWLRSRIRNTDLCELIMFLLAIPVLALLQITVQNGMELDTGSFYGAMMLSTLAAYLLSRPFASEHIAETLVTRATQKHRKAAALDFIAVYPKASWDKTTLGEDLRNETETTDYSRNTGILIESASFSRAEALAELIARKNGSRIIRIDYDVFQKLYGEEKEKYFNKIFEDAKEQSPAVVCFNDAHKFFYKVDASSGEYVKRDHRIYMSAAKQFGTHNQILTIFITPDKTVLDESLFSMDMVSKSFIL